MPGWSGSGTSNTLLAVIAVLLLVIVIQNATNASKTHPFLRADAPQMANPHLAPGHNHPPFQEEEISQPSQPMDFHPTSMMFAALSCPEDPTLTLADPGCESKNADERRQTVENAFSEDLGISQVFDRIVAKYGDSALTPKALEIRRSRQR